MAGRPGLLTGHFCDRAGKTYQLDLIAISKAQDNKLVYIENIENRENIENIGMFLQFLFS